jgi:outer membrane protein
MRRMFFIGLFFSVHVQAMDLAQAYEAALAHDARFTGLRHALAAQRELLPQARAGLLPVVTAHASNARNDGDSDVSGTARPYDWHSRGYTVTLAQPLFRVANWQQYEQSKLLVAQAEAAFSLGQQDLILRLCTAYFGVLEAEVTLASATLQKEAIGVQLESAKHNFEIGAATIADTYEAQSRLDLAASVESAESGNLQIRRGALEEVTGAHVASLAALAQGVRLAPPQPASLAAWIDSAQSANQAVLQQRLQVDIARRDISKAGAGHFPTVDLVVSRNHGNQSADSPFLGRNVSKTNAVGIALNIPLFSGGAITSQVRQALALSGKADADLDAVQRAATQSVTTAYWGMIAGLARIKALEAAELSSDSALSSNRFGYEVGARINIDVLNAQQQFYTTKTQLAKIRYETILNGLKLKAAAGMLGENDIRQINVLLEH